MNDAVHGERRETEQERQFGAGRSQGKVNSGERCDTSLFVNEGWRAIIENVSRQRKITYCCGKHAYWADFLRQPLKSSLVSLVDPC